MIIANPTYDIVFKKLMEDMDISRGILEHILDISIEHLEFAPKVSTTTGEDNHLTYFRLVFKALIATPEGNAIGCRSSPSIFSAIPSIPGFLAHLR